MDVGHAALQDKPHDIVRLRDHRHAIGRQPDGGPRVAAEPQPKRQRHPDERRADNRNDRGQAGQHTPEERIGHSEEQVTRQCDASLHDGQQRDADGVRSNDHANLVQGVAPHPAAEGEQLADVLLHAAAAQQHEVEHEEQDHHIDRKARHPAEEPLPEVRKLREQTPQVALLPQVVARTLLDQRREVSGRGDELAGIERKALHALGNHPDQQRDRHQEAAHRLAQQQPGRRTAPPAVPPGQSAHLPAQQDIDRRGPHQSPQKGGQFDEDDGSQTYDQRHERIAPVLFPDRRHAIP